MPVNSTVSRILWKNRSSVANTIAATDISVVTRKRRSLNVSRLKTERSSSRAVNEKTRLAMPNVVRPIVRARTSPSSCSAPATTASVAAAMTSPATTNQRVSARVRIGWPGVRGRRSMSPPLGAP